MSARTLALEALRTVERSIDDLGEYTNMLGDPLDGMVHEAIAALEAETGEPVAWGMFREDGWIVDVISSEEHATHAGAYVVPLYTARPPAVPQDAAAAIAKAAP
jgi:hypothetical protein